MSVEREFDVPYDVTPALATPPRVVSDNGWPPAAGWARPKAAASLGGGTWGLIWVSDSGPLR